MRQPSPETTKYAAFGMISLVPGMQYMIERMQRELDDMRGLIARLQGEAPAKRGRPRVISEEGRKAISDATKARWAKHRASGRKGLLGATKTKNAASVRSGGRSWAGMSKEERSIEMKRRMAVARKKKRTNGAPVVKIEQPNGRAVA